MRYQPKHRASTPFNKTVGGLEKAAKWTSPYFNYVGVTAMGVAATFGAAHSGQEVLQAAGNRVMDRAGDWARAVSRPDCTAVNNDLRSLQQAKDDKQAFAIVNTYLADRDVTIEETDYPDVGIETLLDWRGKWLTKYDSTDTQSKGFPPSRTKAIDAASAIACGVTLGDIRDKTILVSHDIYGDNLENVEGEAAVNKDGHRVAVPWNSKPQDIVSALIDVE